MNFRRIVFFIFILLFSTLLFASNFVAVLKDIKLFGLKNVSENQVLQILSIKKGDIVSSFTLEDIRKKLASSGYFSDANIQIKWISKTDVVLYIYLKENPKLEKLDILEENVKLPPQLKEEAKSFEGKIFNPVELRKFMNKVVSYFAKKKAILVNVGIDNVDGYSHWILKIRPVVIDSIVIKGNKKTKNYVILREMETKPGKIYSAKALRKDIQRLFDLGFFEEITPHIKPLTDNKVQLELDVKEAKTGMATLGGGYSSAVGFSGYVQIEDSNFRGTGKQVSLRLEIGQVKSYRFKYFDNWFLGKRRDFGFDFYNMRYPKTYYTDLGEKIKYDERRKGYSLLFGKYIFNKNWRFDLRFTDERVELDDKEELVNYLGEEVTKDDDIQKIELLFARRTVDSIRYPTKGYRWYLGFLTTGGFLKGDNEYRKYTNDFRYYKAVTSNNKLIFATRIKGGFIDLVSGEIPVFEKFTVGGGRSLRGYSEAQFSGSKMFLTNLELRWRVVKKIELVGFYDLGDAWDNSSDMKNGRGLGVRIMSPIGVISFEIGRAQGDTKTYFNIGGGF